MVKNLINKLYTEKHLSNEEWVTVLDNYTDDDRKYAEQSARDITVSNYGKKIYFRGIIEFSNICKNSIRSSLVR